MKIGAKYLKTFLVFLVPAGLLAAAANASAAPVYGEPAELTGTRDNFDDGGLTGANGWDGSTPDTQVSLTWSISPVDDYWSYSYTWSGSDTALGRISHFTLDVTDDCLETEDCVEEANSAIEYGEFFGDIDGAGAVKFDDGQVNYSFISDRMPVWGDLCLKDGGGQDNCADLELTDGLYSYSGNTTLLWNTGLGNRSLENALYYVARPDTVNGGPNGNDVPSPGPLALLVAAGLAASLSRFRRT